MSRLPKLERDAMSDQQQAVADAITAGPRGKVRGPFIPLLHNAPAADAVQGMGSFLRFNGTLPGPMREMVILMVAREWTAQYEWFAHHKIALDEGLSPAICDAIAQRETPSFDDITYESVYNFVRELHRDKTVSSETYDRVAQGLGPEGVVELVVLCGHYHTVSMVLNTFDVNVPDGSKPLKEQL